MKKTLFLVLLLATPPGADLVMAQEDDGRLLWRSEPLMLETFEDPSGDDPQTTFSEGHLELICSLEAESWCGDGAPGRETAEGHADELGATLLEVRDWYDEAGLLPSALPIESGSRTVYYYAEDPCDASLACVTDLTRTMIRFGRASAESPDDEMRSTAAHEWFHTAVTSDDASDELSMLSEAMAEAVGQAFAWPGNLRLDPPPRDLALDKPFLMGEEDANSLTGGGYEKAPYFRYAGRELGADHEIGYLRDYMDRLEDDGLHGMTYLYDGPLSGAPFDELFPRFVAELNQPESDRNDSQYNDYYDDGGDPSGSGKIEGIPWPVGDVDAPQPREIELPVEKHAARPLLINPITAQLGEREPRDRLVVAEVEIEDAGGTVAVDDHLHLVYEHRALEGGDHRWLMRLDDENEGPFLRIVNAAPQPENAERRSVKFEASMDPVTVDLPPCVKKGDRAEISFAGASLDRVENFEFRASDGRVEGTTFIAPPRTGDVDIELALESQITRSQSGSIRPDRRPEKTADLGSIPVVEDACMVRMQVVGAPVQATYTAEGDYTEYEMEGGAQRMYAREGDIAMYVASEGGWINMPPGLRKMMMGSLGELPLGGAVPGGSVTPAGMHDLPRRMPEHLGWERVLSREDQLMEQGGSIDPVPCPIDGEHCVAVTTTEGRLIYDDARRLVELRVEGDGDEGVIQWDYGGWDIGIPPGW